MRAGSTDFGVVSGKVVEHVFVAVLVHAVDFDHRNLLYLCSLLWLGLSLRAAVNNLTPR